MSNGCILELKGICKSFGGVRALHEVDLAVRPGEVHALIGENGAGKSTLMKILSGAHQADAGSILIDGVPLTIGSPSEGRRRGIGMIYQELNLAPHLSIEENLTLGMERSSWGFVRGQRERILEVLELLHHRDMPLSTKVGSLPIALKQVVEIARALLCVARVIIMDEPTSSLTAADKDALFEVIGRLRNSGIAVIYISHFLEEVKQIADSYTVLRDGMTAGGGSMKETGLPEIIRLMVGRSLDEMYPAGGGKRGETLLRVESLMDPGGSTPLSFELHKGEVLGIFGLVGSGRSETLRRIFGLDRAWGGQVTVAGGAPVLVRELDPSRALELGLDLLSEDRKEEGLAVRMTLSENTTLSSLSRFAAPPRWGLLDLERERAAARRWIGEMNIRCRGAGQSVGDLSGGNQQKVALARMLERGNDILLLDEPTRGVDVGSKTEIYRLIRSLTAAGKGIVFVSSYLPELLGLCDSLAVMHRGKLSRVRPVGDWTELEIMRVATSGDLGTDETEAGYISN